MNNSLLSTLGLCPVELVVLQGTSFGNLNCTYCDLSVESRRTKLAMDSTLIERFFAELFRSGPLAPEVTVLWHSGEPLTLPPSYYDDAISRILDLKASLDLNDVSVRFGIQTNGVLINDQWCEFFKRHSDRIDVGVSCDGPQELHDLFRVNWNGRTSHSNTLRGMDLLHANAIKYKLTSSTVGSRLSNSTGKLKRPDQSNKRFEQRSANINPPQWTCGLAST